MVTARILIASLFTIALGNPLTRRSMQVHETRLAVPDGFVKAGAPSPDTIINMRIALTQSDPAGLTDALMDVSTPSSANYGQHLTKEEVENFVAPKPETVAAVNKWLSENGLTAKKLSPSGDWIGFEISVSKANELFDTDFTMFKHTETNTDSIRTLTHSIPTDLKDNIQLVHPTISFPDPFGRLPVVSSPFKITDHSVNLTSDAVSPLCALGITPACLQALYGIPTTRATQSSNTLGVSGFIEQFANEADLKTFLFALRPDLSSNTTFTLQTLDGGSNPQNVNEAGVEANLDIQYTIGVASGVPTFFISVGEQFKDGALEGFLDIINFLLGQSNPPDVFTTSYGFNENQISPSLATQLCNAYQQLGARGTSILFASGDGGVSGVQPQSCTTFVPTFPSGCPFLTSVGATSGVPETSATFSSGGFSDVFTTPYYQSSAVSAYLTKLGSMNSGKFNTTGRAYPDVAAAGVNVEIVVGGRTGLVAGTSCASPIFASIIALINDKLVAAGKPPLGFLNPFLYANPGAFNQITTGSNPGCGTNGFPATSGWNPVTGLGTPNFAALAAAAGV